MNFKSYPKTVHENHLFAQCFKTQVSDPPWPSLALIWAPFGSHLASLLSPILAPFVLEASLAAQGQEMAPNYPD